MRSLFQHGCLVSFCLLVLSWSQVGSANEPIELPSVPSDGTEAWLVTFGPGENYWERFGHNAIWLREPAAGLDHTFNFGFFDFEQKDFFLRFMQGRMLYFSIAQAASREFEQYRQDGRSIRIQKLNLTSQQYEQLRDYLVDQIQPENRNYRYDYYLNNCSTRIRDALDIALDGELSVSTRDVPASLNFRDQTRRLTQRQFWYYLGLELALGYPVDRPVTRWDEMFIPMVVADELAAMSQLTAKTSEPLLSVDELLFSSTLPLVADSPTIMWYRYLLIGLLIIGLAWLSGRFMPRVWLDGLSLAWVMISATIGMILAALWLFTDHESAWVNANLLLQNPLVIVGLVPVLRRFAAVLLAAGTIIALLLLLLPVHQYNLDVLALLAPVNFAVAVRLLGSVKAKESGELSIR